MGNNSVLTEITINRTSDYAVTVLPEWSVYLFIATNVIILVLGVLGNGVILLVEQFNKQKTSTDWMIIFMAANDFILSGCNSPIIILMYSGIWSKVGSDALCGLMFFVQENLSYSCTLLLTVTAVDRYIKTCRPLTTVITPKRSLIICLGITVFTIFFALPIPFYLYYDDVTKCRYKVTSATVSFIFKVILIIIQGTYVVMFVIVIFSYCKIGLTIRNRQKKMMRSVHPFPLVSHNTADTSTRFAPNQQSQMTSLSVTDSRVPEQTTPASTKQENVDLNLVVPMNNQASTSKHLNMKTNTFEAESDVGRDEKERTLGNKTITNLERQNASKQAQMNKTTCIMFAVTMVFILSWIPTWANSILWPRNQVHSEADQVAALFCRRAFMINTCTNPFFYIGMSSLFRKLTKQTISKIWHRR